MKIDSWRKILKIVTLHNIKEDKRVDLSFVALTSFDGKKKERGFDVDYMVGNSPFVWEILRHHS